MVKMTIRSAFALAAVQVLLLPVLASPDLEHLLFSTQAKRASNGGDGPDDNSSSSQSYTCTKTKGCSIGCCGPLDDHGNGVCGGGPKFCGQGCTSQCDWKSECDPGWGLKYSNASTCPLNVCCSKYGFCGTSSDFCGHTQVANPSCAQSQHTSDGRTVGYWEGWNWQRPCDRMDPSQIPLGYYTHLNFAFALIEPGTYYITDMDSTTATYYERLTSLKTEQVGLQVWISVGGWSMQDPGPYHHVFSDMASSEANQDAFINSLMTFMDQYGFDGADLDWEYPAVPSRGGSPDDFDNLVTLIKNIRSKFDASGRKYGLSITLPSSYWYMRHFDIVAMEPYLDFFNVMTYDIYGTWDEHVASIGSYAYADTNLTAIYQTMDLLWRNNINPGRVNMGLGFYGRSYTMTSASCMSAGCPFSAGGKPGPCTQTSGILSSDEIQNIIKDGASTTLDKAAAVEMVTWDANQWVSWDDKQTLGMKVDYANSRCLGGTMVWAVDLDNGYLIDALGENMNRSKKPVFNNTFIQADLAAWSPLENTSSTG